MSAPTPGPWVVGEDIADSYMIYPEGKFLDPWIADAKGPHVGVASKEEALANAVLIAAAPDLLAALEAMLATPEIADCDPRDKDEETRVAERMARAAIAKAKGETT